MLSNEEFRSIFGTCAIHCCTESRNHFHSSNREGCGHVLVSLNIGSLNGQLSIETATHSHWARVHYLNIYLILPGNVAQTLLFG